MYLITPTLLNGWQYYLQYDGEDPAKNREEFLNLLAKKKFEKTEAMQKGIEFETAIAAQGNGIDYEGDSFDPAVIKMLSSICGREKGLWQIKLQKDLGEDLLYGVCDVIHQNTIYDIKYTQNYDTGKFYASMQHRIYLHCTGLPRFAYLVSNGKEFWEEDYFYNKKMEDEIRECIYNFKSYLKTDETAQQLFEQNWKKLIKG
jgi:hypothetical protein